MKLCPLQCDVMILSICIMSTQIQYEFIHDALLEALFCQDTTLGTADVERTWAEIRRDDTWVVYQHRVSANSEMKRLDV